DRICCPVILWGNANVSNSTSASSTSTQSSSNGVRTLYYVMEFPDSSIRISPSTPHINELLNAIHWQRKPHNLI
uniref:Uncharacterized protein n=1 Tax=Amphimedon queenslandica TaxID=400682 RepID=A0A1X7SZE4_AMPQE